MVILRFRSFTTRFFDRTGFSYTTGFGPVFLAAVFFDDPFLVGTFSPSSFASDKPMAMACLRKVTFLPLPVFKVPYFLSCMACSTFWPAPLEYLAMLFIYNCAITNNT